MQNSTAASVRALCYDIMCTPPFDDGYGARTVTFSYLLKGGVNVVSYKGPYGDAFVISPGTPHMQE